MRLSSPVTNSAVPPVCAIFKGYVPRRVDEKAEGKYYQQLCPLDLCHIRIKKGRLFLFSLLFRYKLFHRWGVAFKTLITGRQNSSTARRFQTGSFAVSLCFSVVSSVSHHAVFSPLSRLRSLHRSVALPGTSTRVSLAVEFPLTRVPIIPNISQSLFFSG